MLGLQEMQNWILLPWCPKVLCWSVVGGASRQAYVEEGRPDLALASLSRSLARQDIHALERTRMGTAA